MDNEQLNTKKLKAISDEIDRGVNACDLRRLRKKLYRIDVSNDSCSNNKFEKTILLQCIKEMLE